MKLWHVARIPGSLEYFLCDDEGTALVMLHSRERAQQIADEHNAWVILMERGWAVEMVDGWVVFDNFDGLKGYNNKSHDTPVAAVLAADAYLKERGQ